MTTERLLALNVGEGFVCNFGQVKRSSFSVKISVLGKRYGRKFSMSTDRETGVTKVTRTA